jgi:hypothetical protein
VFFRRTTEGLQQAQERVAQLVGVNSVQWKNPWWYPSEDLFWDLVAMYQGDRSRRASEVEKAVRMSLKKLPNGQLAKAWHKDFGQGTPSIDSVLDRAAIVRARKFYGRLPRTDLWLKFEELGWSAVDKAVATLALLGFSKYSLPDRMRQLSTRRNLDPFFSLVIQILQNAGLVPKGGGSGRTSVPMPPGSQPQGAEDDGEGEDGEEEGEGGGGRSGKRPKGKKRKQPQGSGGGDNGEDEQEGEGALERMGLEGEDGWDGTGPENGDQYGHPGVKLGQNPTTAGAMGAGNAHLNLEFLRRMSKVVEAMKELHIRYSPAEARNVDLIPVQHAADDIEIRQIQDFREMPTPFDLALPEEIFDMRAATRTLTTYQHFEEVPRSKRFGMLIDVSGSMSGAPFTYAVASAVALMHNAIRGRNEVVLRLFDAQPYPALRGQPDKVAAYLMLMPFSNGGTDIGAAVAKMARDDDPDEIIVISDGDDHKAIKKPTRKSDGSDIPVHVIFVLHEGYRSENAGYMEKAEIRKNATTFEMVPVKHETDED